MKRISALEQLGQQLLQLNTESEIVQKAYAQNSWFTPGFTIHALHIIAKTMLKPELLNKWLSAYTLSDTNKTIALIFAGNVPLAGFHDFLCCYLTGSKAHIKLSSKDTVLMPFVIKTLASYDPEVLSNFKLTEKLEVFDAVIATGSDNSNRYFEYYFGKFPNILRKNRNSVAVLSGNETTDELALLADDIFLYFGLGCRNVSKIYLPSGYDLNQLKAPFEKYNWLFNHASYMNNYDYKRTLLLMNKTPHFSTDYFMMTENSQLSSPISTIHYENYRNVDEVITSLKQNVDAIQCIVSGIEAFSGAIPFGQAQSPALNEYADGVDTIAFLLGLK